MWEWRLYHVILWNLRYWLELHPWESSPLRWIMGSSHEEHEATPFKSHRWNQAHVRRTMHSLDSSGSLSYSRPLTPLLYEEDLQVLTPGHFLIRKNLQALPDPPSLQSITMLCRWELCQYLVRHFWKRWYMSTWQHFRSYRNGILHPATSRFETLL